MANDGIKQKIILEGEQEYNAALKEARRNLKTLRSELKAETAELGANATAQQKNEAKIKSLQKQIKEQEKIVNTYKAALKEVKEKYGDNAEAVAKWEVKLNEARSTLANMKNSLDDVGDGLKSIENSAGMATLATNAVAETLGRIGDVGESISSSIEGIFSNVLGAVRDTITAIWGEVVDLAARSNNLVDLAGYWNTDVTTIQKYKGAVESVSGTLEDLNGIVTKINSKDSKTIAELVGVSKAEYDDEWKYAMAVMDAMSKLDTKKRNDIGFELFGKGATKAFDILNDWENLLTHLDEFDVTKGGFGLTNEELQNMSQLYDKVNELKASWQALQDMATVKLFGSLSLDLTSNAQAILDALLKYFNAGTDEEREAALKEIEDNVTAMFERIGQAIEDGLKALGEIAKRLKASDNPVVKKLGELMEALKGALEWITADNMQNVVDALEKLAIFWGSAKAATMITKIAAFASNIKILTGAGGVAAAGNAASAGTAAGTSWGTAFAKAVAAAAPWLIGLYTLLNPAAGSDALGDNTLVKDGKLTDEAIKMGYSLDENGNLKQNASQIEDQYVDPEFREWMKLQEEKQDWADAALTLTPAQIAAAEKFWDIDRENPGAFTDEQWDEFERAFEGNDELFGKINDMMDYLKQSSDEEEWRNIEDLPAEWWTKHGGNTGNQDGLTSADAHSITEAVNRMPNAVKNGVSGLRVVMDGQTVGHIVAPYVSAAIATGIL